MGLVNILCECWTMRNTCLILILFQNFAYYVKRYFINLSRTHKVMQDLVALIKSDLLKVHQLQNIENCNKILKVNHMLSFQISTDTNYTLFYFLKTVWNFNTCK